MSKLYLAAFLSCFLMLSSCDKKNSENSSSETASADSLAKDSVAVAQPDVQLSEKASLVAQSWKASEFETPAVKLSAELIDIKLKFNPDNTFEYSEDGKKQTGKWKLNEEETMLMLEYDDSRKADHDIKELSAEKMIIAGKEHGMYRTLTLVPKK